MKDRLNSYQDVYVAACGEIFTSTRLGLDHEKGCLECQQAMQQVIVDEAKKVTERLLFENLEISQKPVDKP